MLRELGKARLLSIIFERLGQLGEVPEDWKVADVTSVFRREDPGNFRLVSLASIPEKVVEQIIPEAISKHVDKRVTGIKTGKSCFTNLIDF